MEVTKYVVSQMATSQHRMSKRKSLEILKGQLGVAGK